VNDKIDNLISRRDLLAHAMAGMESDIEALRFELAAHQVRLDEVEDQQLELDDPIRVTAEAERARVQVRLDAAVARRAQVAADRAQLSHLVARLLPVARAAGYVDTRGTVSA
jgi:hypothetical protein